MNHLSIYTSLQVMCDLATREPHATAPLPASIRPAEFMEITDPQLFTSTALLRLESESPLLRGLAERSLMAVIKFL